MSLGVQDFHALLTQIDLGKFTLSQQKKALAGISQLFRASDPNHPMTTRIHGEMKYLDGKGRTVRHNLVKAIRREVTTLAKVAAYSESSEIARASQALQGLLGLKASAGFSALPSQEILQRAREWAHVSESPITRLVDNVLKIGAPLSQPPRISLNGRILRSEEQLPELLQVLKRHFGRDVERRQLELLIQLPVNGYCVNQVKIYWDEGKPLWMEGRISSTASRKQVGKFEISVPPAPADATNWTARIEDIGMKEEKDQQQGVGKHLLIRVLKFLYDMKLYALEVDARENASYFCSHMGFTTDRQTYQTLLARFEHYLDEKGHPLNGEEKYTLSQKEDLARLADFKIEGQEVGKEFLLSSFREEPLRVFFWLRSSYPGWVRIAHQIDKQMLMAPPEWEGLGRAARQWLLEDNERYNGQMTKVMTSDEGHAQHLIERINNWASLPSVIMFPREGESHADLSERFKEHVDAICDVLKMVAAADDPQSRLFHHFKEFFLCEIRSRSSHLASLLRAVHGRDGFEIPQRLMDLVNPPGQKSG